MTYPIRTIVFVIAMLSGGVFHASADAGEADVVGVEFTRDGPTTYSFSVTVGHGDTGWDHYADAWQVVGPDGMVLGERILAHPHENEQPFTRSLSGVIIPEGINKVTIRARDLVHGFGGAEMIVDLREAPGKSTSRP